MTPHAFFINFVSSAEPEDVCCHTSFREIDCRDIRGTRSYCDSGAAAEIRRRLRDVPSDAIHFIDSGNYHYVTCFFLEKLTESFNLAVFDRHSDMQPPAFSGLLSCGGWVLHAMESNSYLQNVFLTGIGEDQYKTLEALPPELRNRVYVDRIPQTDLPFYCSIDKDVLSPDVFTADWDQGNMSLDELAQQFRELCRTSLLLGLDVCGGTGTGEIPEINKAADRKLLELYGSFSA